MSVYSVEDMLNGSHTGPGWGGFNAPTMAEKPADVKPVQVSAVNTRAVIIAYLVMLAALVMSGYLTLSIQR